jgi:hypothetical protein
MVFLQKLFGMAARHGALCDAQPIHYFIGRSIAYTA